MAQIVNAQQFKEEIKEGLVIVDFFSERCEPCKMLAPLFEEAEEVMAGKVKFIKVDTDKDMALAQDYQVAMLPTLLVFKDGKKVDLLAGISPVEKIKTRLNAFL